MNCFENNGFASASYLSSKECKDIFEVLEQIQDEFLKHEKEFRSVEYVKKWPSDALHWWSRCWEYPYVLYHLKKLKQSERMTVLDLGSGVTFFPTAVARQNCDVCAVDVDEIVGKDLPAATRHVSPLPGTVSVLLSDGNSLPNGDSEMDVVYSISVLEHLENYEEIISEVHRVLKPNGHFILTIDVDIKGSVSIGASKFYNILGALSRRFEAQYLNSMLHPQDLLTSSNSTYPLHEGSGSKTAFHRIKSEIKVLLGYKEREVSELCCYGAVFKRVD